MCLYPFNLKYKYSDLAKDSALRRLLSIRDEIELPCGHCVECLREKAREWSFRISQESALYVDNCFVTLTYNDKHCDGSVHRRDIQLFIKRLRKRFSDRKIRVFYCGEYGSKGLRPHYHIILFNFRPDDLVFLKRTKRGELIYRSAVIEELWTMGFSSVGDVNSHSAKYCAKYMQKLVQLPDGVEPSFLGMSNRPGIGAYCVNSSMLDTDKIYIDGKYIKLPRYYLKVLERVGYDLSELKQKRIYKASVYLDNNINTDIILKRKQQADFIGKPFDQ